MNITVNDLPISGKFKIVWCGHILHQFNGTGSGDIAPDIASLPVLNTYESNGYLVIEVPGAERYRVIQVTDDGTRSTVCNVADKQLAINVSNEYPGSYVMDSHNSVVHVHTSTGFKLGR